MLTSLVIGFFHLKKILNYIQLYSIIYVNGNYIELYKIIIII